MASHSNWPMNRHPMMELISPNLRVRTQYISLREPLEKAQQLTLEGTLPVEIVIPASETLLASPRTMEQKFVNLEVGGRAWIQNLNRSGTTSSMTLVLTSHDPALQNPARWMIDLIDANGQRRAGMISPLQPWRPFIPEDLYIFADVNQLPWSGIGQLSKRSSTFACHVSFQSGDLLDPKSTLRLRGLNRKVVELPVAFKDIPLP